MFPSCEAVGKIMRNFYKECAMFFGLYLLFLPLSVGPHILIPQKSGKGRHFIRFSRPAFRQIHEKYISYENTRFCYGMCHPVTDGW